MFGSKFHFKVFNEDKTTSRLGGTMTLIAFLMLGLFTYLFGHDFFYRVNPRVTQSNFLPNNYSLFNVQEEKIKIPWRIEDNSAIPIDPTGVLYPMLYYYSSERNPDTSEFEDYQIKYLNYYLCNATDVDSDKENDLPLGSYYCIDFENQPLGGFWDGNFIYYLEIQIYFCPNGKPVGDNNNCTNIDKLKEYLNSDNPWYFTIYYPTHQFQSENYDTPIKIHYSTHYTPINPITRKNDKIFFKEIQLIDDKGIIFETKKHSHYWIVDKLVQEYKHHPEDKLFEKGHSSKLYTMNIYVSIEKEIYTRIYEKLYNVLAVVGGFSQIITTVFRIFCEYFNMIKMRTTLLNSSFYFERKGSSNKKSPSLNKYPLKVLKTHKQQNLHISNSSEIEIHQPHFSNIMLSNQKVLSIRPKDPTKIKTCNITKSISKDSGSFNNSSLYQIKTRKYLTYKFHKVKCIRKLFLKGNIVKNNYFILAFKYIDKLIDLRSYLLLNKEILILKYFFLDTNHLIALANLRKYYWYKEIDKKLLRIAVGYHHNEKHDSSHRNISKEEDEKDLDKYLNKFMEGNKLHREFMREKNELNMKSNQSTNVLDNINMNQVCCFVNNKDKQKHIYITDVNRHNGLMENYLMSNPINKRQNFSLTRTGINIHFDNS